MAGIPLKYWRVCDRCGDVSSIASSDTAGAFHCAECGSDTGWEFTTEHRAIQHSFDIQAGRSRPVAT